MNFDLLPSLYIGTTFAIFSSFGISSAFSERFVRCAIGGASSSAQSFSIHVGIRSGHSTFILSSDFRCFRTSTNVKYLKRNIFVDGVRGKGLDMAKFRNLIESVFNC